MEIHTLVSLCIGIFGATYAALNALRTHAESQITKFCELASSKLEEVKKLKRSKGIANCVKHHGRTIMWKRIWFIAQVIPAIIFFTFMVFMAVWVIDGWDEVTARHDSAKELADLHQCYPWVYFRPAFFVMCLVDLTALLVAFAAWGLCAHFSGRVGEIKDSMEEDDLKDPEA